MIIETIFNVLVGLLLGVIGIFPTFPTIDTSGMDGVIQALSLVDTFVSLRVVSACLVVIFVVANGQLLWSVVMWVIRKIPGLS